MSFLRLLSGCTTRDVAPFFKWAEEVTEFDQTSIVGLFKVALITLVMRSSPNAMIVIETLKVCRRLEFHVKYKGEWDLVKDKPHLALKKNLVDF